MQCSPLGPKVHPVQCNTVQSSSAYMYDLRVIAQASVQSSWKNDSQGPQPACRETPGFRIGLYPLKADANRDRSAFQHAARTMVAAERSWCHTPRCRVGGQPWRSHGSTRDGLPLRRSPRDAGALARRGHRVLRLAIPIQLMLFPVAVPSFFEGLDLGGGCTGIPSQRQDGGPD